MKSFMDSDFMLKNDTAIRLFHKYAKPLPLIDYHCHISPKEIYEDRRYANLTEVWLGGRNEDGTYFGDHYKWRLMRSHGIPEEKITGTASPYDKFYAFAEALEMAIGNPMYHWCNLELQKYFGITTPLTTETARSIWDKTCALLQNDSELSVCGIIRKSNVTYIGTTDDPVDSLEWHEKLAAKSDLGFQVTPSFRPDKAIHLHKEGFAEYIRQLAASVGKEQLDTFEDVCDALDMRLEHFTTHGCKAADHGLDYVPFKIGTPEEISSAYQKALLGQSLTKEEIDMYQTAILTHLGKQYHKKGLVMEIHYSCLRNINERMYKLEGADTGFDMIAKNNCEAGLAHFLSHLDATNELPKTILFSLDHNDFNIIGTCMGAFQSEEIPSKIQMGAAWWFLDTKDGMEEQMHSLANLGLLGHFVGMLTDSRSFLSYTRHDYFRRIMCNLIGQWVEDGEYPDNEASLKKIVENICYLNAKRYFDI